jgi:hypothetical protein
MIAGINKKRPITLGSIPLETPARNEIKVATNAPAIAALEAADPFSSL